MDHTDHRKYHGIQPADGKLGVMIAGMGAVATTFVAGVEAIRGLAQPIGSLTQMGTIRLGKRTDARCPKIRDFLPLADLNDLVFTGWDIFTDDMYAAASKAGVLDRELLERMQPFLESIKPLPAVFNRNYVRKLDGPNVKEGKNKMRLAEELRADIREFKRSSGARRFVMIWCGSTEIFLQPREVHQSLKAFVSALESNDENISPSMIYAYAALSEGVPFANGAPNLTVDIPAMHELSRLNEAPICGKDFKTGQTLVKTILAPGFKARMLGLHGWYSTNILGNRDGEVLDDPESFKTKEVSKLGVLETSLVLKDSGSSSTSPSRLPRMLRSRSSECWSTFCSRRFTPSCTARSSIRSASTTIRPAGITRRAGTTSTSSVGSVTRCRSRSTSCAAIPSWRPLSCSTSCCFSTSLNAVTSCAAWESKNGSASISNHR